MEHLSKSELEYLQEVLGNTKNLAPFEDENEQEEDLFEDEDIFLYD